MKKIISILLVIITVTSVLTVSAFADGNSEFIFDEANVLKSEERTAINSSLSTFSENWGIDTKVFLVKSKKGTELIFDAENLYKENGMDDGILLLIDCSNKTSALFAGGKAQDLLQEYECEEISFTVNDIIASKGFASALYGFIAATGSKISADMISTPGFNGSQHIPSQRLVPRLVDNACLLSASEEKELIKLLDGISSKHNIDVTIATVNYLDSRSPSQFADDWYDYNGYSEDGILFLISIGKRDWAISTAGYGITAFTDAGQGAIFKSMKKDLSKDRFNKAFITFSNSCDKFLKKAEKGKPYDSGNLPKGPMPVFYYLVCVVIAAVAGGLGTSALKSQLTTVSMNDSARFYTRKDSLHVPEQRDMFLYSTVSKNARPKETSSGGSSRSRGSSSHRSSSGRSHGGSSGKF